MGDRNYWLPDLKALLQQLAVALITPFSYGQSRSTSELECPAGSGALSHQDRLQSTRRPLWAKWVQARDLWYPRNRLLRMLLMHTLAVLFNIQEENEPFQLARLLA